MLKLRNDHEVDQGMSSANMAMSQAEVFIKLSQDRIIFISEIITKQVAIDLSALLLYYDNEDHVSPITIYLHTDGGDASGLSNIYDVMQLINAPIQTICSGKCYSAGAVILASGTKGERYAFKNSKIMMHGIQCGFPIPGHDMINSKNYYEFLKDNNDNIMKILSKHTGNNLAKVKQDCLKDMFFSAEEAKNYGIIDHVI